MNVSISLTDNAARVLERRYLTRDESGQLVETPAQMFRRVAEAVAAVAENPPQAEAEFLQVMAELEFLPNSPTLMNAGKDLGQLSACFVLPVDDAMESIFESVKHTAMIHKSGGGTGFSFSRLRPAGSTVASTGGVSSGPVSFMKVFDTATDVIKQGGKRRGANMGVLRVDHPDIREFIYAKEDPNRFNNFNLSVALTDRFMQALERGKTFDLVDPHTGLTAGSLSAREIFDEIVYQAWKGGDPGILFLDRINQDNPTPTLGEFEGTNPCVTADTFVQTEGGPRQVRDLLDYSGAIMVNGQSYPCTSGGFFSTGKKSVLRLETLEGYALRLTENHPILKAETVTRKQIRTRWARAGDLEPGDRIMLNDHRLSAGWDGPFDEREGYLIGLLVGDGTLKQDKAVLSVWAAKSAVAGSPGSGTLAVMQAALRSASELPHRADFKGWTEVPGRNEFRLSLGHVKSVARQLGLAPGRKQITPALERCSSGFYRGFLRGIFDADGSVQGTQRKGVSVRLAQSDLAVLEAVQRMLLRLGIAGRIYQGRRPAGSASLPDGRGGRRYYATREQHELVLANDNLLRFQQLIGFADADKRSRLEDLLRKYRRRPNRERFLATVRSLTPAGREEVYDIRVPAIHAFDANGLVVHNCGEQPLLPYESCNLGSINLAKMVRRLKNGWTIDEAHLDRVVETAVRFLDNVIDVNRFPLPQIEQMTKGNRKIGLGVMGLADLFIRLGIPYDSPEALQTARRIMHRIRQQALATSAGLAEIRGPFPNFPDSTFAQRGEPPLRNATVTTIAPTGTLSIIAGCSSGIEPLFALSYIRKVMDNEELLEVHPLFVETAKEMAFYSDDLMRRVAEVGSIRLMEEIPQEARRLFVTAHDIEPEWHVRIQSAFQADTDNAVSKTVNFPHDAMPEDVARVYLLAYEEGCKGVTIYRDRSRDAQVLNIGRAAPAELAQVPAMPPAAAAPMAAAARPGPEAGGHPRIAPRPRPMVTQGATERIGTGCGKLYVTVNYDEEGICEVFAQMGKSGGCAASQIEGIGRLISLALRSHVSLDSIIKQMRGIRCPAPLWGKGGMVLSCADAIARILEHHSNEDDKSRNYKGGVVGICPDCGGAVEPVEGCEVCRFCGFTRCS
jgi:ribonucleoside-diphosphate reductase alpha chain